MAEITKMHGIIRGIKDARTIEEVLAELALLGDPSCERLEGSFYCQHCTRLNYVYLESELLPVIVEFLQREAELNKHIAAQMESDGWETVRSRTVL